MWKNVKKYFVSKGTQKDCDTFKEIQKIFAVYPFERITKEPETFELAISEFIPDIHKLYKAEIVKYMNSINSNNNEYNAKNPDQPRPVDYGLDLSKENLVVILKTAINNEITRIKRLCSSHLLSSNSLQKGGAVKPKPKPKRKAKGAVKAKSAAKKRVTKKK